MERDTTDELIDFFANSDVHNNYTLALALLEPLKVKKADPVEFQQEQPTENKIKNEEKIEKAFAPIKAIIDEISGLGFQTQADKILAQVDILQNLIKKSFEDNNEKDKIEEIEIIDSKPSGHEAFLRDHNLLPRLIAHPNMTLAKILKVYPNLPYPKYFNKYAKLNKLLGEWLPFVSNYSRLYQVERDEPDVHDLVVKIMKMITNPNPKKKRKKTKDQTVSSLEVVKDCSSKS